MKIVPGILRHTVVLLFLILFAQCEVTIPRKEDSPELITKIQLVFTPWGGGPSVTAAAIDPDGEGIQNIQPQGSILLSSGTTYDMQIILTNELVGPGNEAYDISKEVESEGDEHLFLFAWTSSLFSDPAGDGNIDTRTDPVNYADIDINGLPIGLYTSWTAAAASNGEFRVVLKHQPGFKSEISTAADGETDLDITFQVEVQ